MPGNPTNLAHAGVTQADAEIGDRRRGAACPNKD